MAYQPGQVKKAVRLSLKAGHTPMLWGSPSTAKTSVLREIAEELKLKVIYVDLMSIDLVDLNGVISKSADGKRGIYLPMQMFPLEGDPIPKGYRGFLLIFDELTNCPPSYIQSILSVVYDKRLGGNKLHPRCFIAAAGNLISDKCGTFAIPSSLKRRVVHFEVELSYKHWRDNWAIHNNIDYRVMAFLEAFPDKFYTFNPEDKSNTYACGGSWEMLSDVLKHIKELDLTALCLLQGYIPVGIARELIMYCSIYNDKGMPPFEEILKEPRTVHFDTAPSYQYALQGLVAANSNKQNIEKIMLFVNRLSIEFAVICVKQINAKTKGIGEMDCIEEFVENCAKEFS